MTYFLVSKPQRCSEDCFYSVPSPGPMALFCRDLVFHDHSTYVMALADALSQEYQQIAKHGLLLQVPNGSQWFPVLNVFGCLDLTGGSISSVDLRRSLGFVCTGRWTVPTWAWAATPSGRISVRPDSVDFSKVSSLILGPR